MFHILILTQDIIASFPEFDKFSGKFSRLFLNFNIFTLLLKHASQRWSAAQGFAGLLRREFRRLRAASDLCPRRLVVAKSACLRFRLTAKTATAPLLLLFPANPLRWASPGATMDWAKRRRGRLRMDTSCPYSPFPAPCLQGNSPLRGRLWPARKNGVLGAVPPGPPGPGLQKLGVMRFTPAPGFAELTLLMRICFLM